MTDVTLTAGFDITGATVRSVINGREPDAALAVPLGARVRIRLIIIPPADPVVFEIVRDGTVMQWRARAKDGLDLPPAQAVKRPRRARCG